jgi:septal ring factor EnvC (AmiA/AmiB activator)
MQAPTVPSADGGTYAELQEKYKTQEVNLKAANDTIERQREALEAAEKTRQELQAKFKTLEKERDTWKQSCIQRTEELKALKEDYKNLQAINEVCGE